MVGSTGALSVSRGETGCTVSPAGFPASVPAVPSLLTGGTSVGSGASSSARGVRGVSGAAGSSAGFEIGGGTGAGVEMGGGTGKEGAAAGVPGAALSPGSTSGAAGFAVAAGMAGASCATASPQTMVNPSVNRQKAVGDADCRLRCCWSLKSVMVILNIVILRNLSTQANLHREIIENIKKCFAGLRKCLVVGKTSVDF